MRDSEMKAVSLFGTVVLTAAVFAPVLFLTEQAKAQKADFGEMEAIEASVAYKKAPVKQPQKKVKEPDPVEKPEGVSHDENKKPPDQKKDEQKKPKKDDTDPLAKFHHPTDDDSPTGNVKPDPGDFNGESYGWAAATTGHPFWRKLVADFRQGWEIPTISVADAKVLPAACFHITPEGKIQEFKFKEKSGNEVLDDSVQRGLDALKKLRDATPTPVPNELLNQTNRWVCFRFNPNSGG
jgi:hypothetical protein